MSKVSDSYDSLTRGVSQQSAHDRLPGQHWEQDNMISDPVRGLSRRHGSVWCDEVQLPELFSLESMSDDLAARLEDTLFLHGVEYALFRRDGTVPASGAPPIIMVNKGSRKFVPTRLSAEAEAIAREGVSSVCTAGKFVLLAAAKRPVTHSVTDNIAPTAKQHVLWFRGGAYSRTYIVTATTPAGVEKKYEYTTMKSYYDKPLDTSDIPHLKPDGSGPNPDYNKLVNDRSNAYNSAVNKHIADAAKDITPENLATKMAELLRVDYPTAKSDGPYVLLDAEGVTLSGDDGGNGEFLRTASRDVTSPELLTAKHFPGKVMIVQPKAAGSVPYYMVAVSSTGATGFTEVIWREAAGEVVQPLFLFMIGVLQNGELCIGSTPADLAAMTGTEVPVFEPSTSGDTKNRPLPELFGRALTYIRMFQDRLMMVAGSTVFLSKTGDYFAMFAESMLLVRDDDPIEVFAQGTEDDTITAGVQLDRNLVLFGRRFQYIVPGKDNMTPRNAYIGVAATYEGANLVAPSVGGSLLFFCQRRENRLTMQQMQPGSVADRLEAFDVSAQLDGYLTGRPQQIVAQTSPSAVFIKTRELRHGFYIYSFLDSNDQTQRMFDSWSRWTFNPRLGVLAGISSDDSGLLAVTARKVSTGNVLVLDRFSRETVPSPLPYLDSIRKGITSTLLPDDAYAAFDNTTARYLLGAALVDAPGLAKRFPTEASSLHSGMLYDSFVTLTSPYLRDEKDRVILDAKLTVTKLTVSLAYSAGVDATISTDGGKTYKLSTSWIARPVGGWVLNTQRVEEQKTLPVPVMKDNKTYRTRLAARNWLPMTISVVEWAGQAFTSRR